MLINGARLCPDRVVDILEACGALDLSSSLSRDVNSYFDFFMILLSYRFSVSFRAGFEIKFKIKFYDTAQQ